ncbi:putative ascorbate peroxidase [Tigriopus californicus]|nr:putative ascorbate peroxidase [Tigriopus californicus]
MAFFAIEFGLGPRLGTALSGAHTLGGAAGAAGSGFLGFWKENATEAAKFDARYFSLMADPDLNWNLVNAALQTNANSPRWQWEGFRDNEQVSFMLNSDVALLLDIQPNAEGRSSCNFDTCQQSQTAILVKIYGRFPNFWIRDFSVAFTRMVEN